GIAFRILYTAIAVQHTIFIKGILFAADAVSSVLHHPTGRRSHIISPAVVFQPAGMHLAFLEPAGLCLFKVIVITHTGLYPAYGHLAAAVEVILSSVYGLPGFLPDSVAGEIIPAAVILDPSGLH